MNILLDYFFPITSITPTPQASTAFLKQVCVVARPKAGQEGNVGQIFSCVNMTQVAARTDNTEALELFNAGMSKVFILLADTLDLAEALEGKDGDFYTVLIASGATGFDEEDIEEGIVTLGVKASVKFQDITYTAKNTGSAGNSITITYVDDGTAGSETVGVVGSAITVHMEDGASTAQNILDAIEGEAGADALVDLVIDEGDEDDTQLASELDDTTPIPTPLVGGVTEVTGGDGLQVGGFKGVVGVSSADEEFLEDQAAIENRVAFFRKDSNGAKNMFSAFGKLLSNALNWRNQQYITMDYDDEVESLGQANTLFDARVSFVLTSTEYGKRLAMFAVGGKAIVEPYIKRNLQLDLQSQALSYISGNQPAYTLKEAAIVEDKLQDVMQSYIDRQWIDAGTVAVTLVADNFVASADLNIAEPKAFWRIFGEMRQTL